MALLHRSVGRCSQFEPFENKAMAMAAKTYRKLMTKWAAAQTPGMHPPITHLDLVYFGTGNGGPYPQIVRSPEGGDNLLICSILAVRAIRRIRLALSGCALR